MNGSDNVSSFPIQERGCVSAVFINTENFIWILNWIKVYKIIEALYLAQNVFFRVFISATEPIDSA